ncbi:heme lyase CcmF/NrfE family subunit [Alicyclobacillus tolerans]|uniref:heme lyase CcmF/NrfE family subunit n=1 Tax=Alicyclobacillus tolerans TaxID=90970 RepID=UPI001F2215DA|nr:heme lyase CcmF/NrfE family subunit [Alicyclobacillus tolerans]MCF8563397.1 heme lyase CcmF/NrfE family subunit [Alicyclobacillus tolerans]
MLIGSVGNIAVRLLFAVSVLSLAVHGTAIWKKTSGWRKFSRFSMLGQFVLAALASLALIWLLVDGNFWYSYVVDYTSAGLPLIYRIAAFWGGDAGSLLFWTLVLTLYGMVVAFSRHEDSERMLPIVSLLVTGVTVFYMTLLNVAANPFVRLPQPAAMGNGLNPLLQNPGMTVHPVNVYLGFVGFTIPFAYAMTGLLLKKTDATWLKVTRRWTLISWLFLSIGIVYGAHWSYEELGWGGYWAWDPVENASLLPWLTATAFLHSAIVQERRGMLKGWNVILVTLTYVLTLLGTFLTRSGVLWSIHAFANGLLGSYYMVFMSIVLIFSVTVIILRWPTLKAERKFDAVISKESSFMLNNVLFLGVTFAVVWGTLLPLISEALTGQKMMVSAPFYNEVSLPLAVCIMVLMGIGPVVAWRKASMKSVVVSVVYPLAAAVGIGLVIAVLLKSAYQVSSTLSTAAIIAAVFVTITVVMEFYRSVRARVVLTGENWMASVSRLVSKNRRRYGGYVVHLALAVMAVGIAGSGAYHISVQKAMSVGDSVQIGGYQAKFVGTGVNTSADGTTRDLYGNLVISRNHHNIGVLRPSATFYANGNSPTTNVALYTRPLRDLYVVMIGTQGGNQAIFDFHINPLVQFIWYGGYLFIVGTMVSLWPESFRRRKAQLDAALLTADSYYADLAELEYDYQMGKLQQDEYEVNKQELLGRVRSVEDELKKLRAELEREVAAEVARVRTLKHAGGGPV